MKTHRRFLFLLTLLCTACATNEPKSTESSAVAPPPSKGFLIREPDFTNCELEAFISLTVARNAIALGVTKESLLNADNTGEFQTAMINELFQKMEEQSLKNYPLFAAEKFYQCAERVELSVPKKLDAAVVCLARQDIPFFLYARKSEGFAQAEAIASVKEIFANASSDLYPEALIDQTAPMVYRTRNQDDYYELRRFSFETCLFPSDWKAWWNSEHPTRQIQ